MSDTNRLSVQTLFKWLCFATFLWLVVLSFQIGFLSTVIFIGVALIASVAGAISVVFSFSSFVDYLAQTIRSSGKLSDVIQPVFQYGKIGFTPNQTGLEQSVNDFPLPLGTLKTRFILIAILVWIILVLFPSLYPQNAPAALNFWPESDFNLPTLVWSFLTLSLSATGSYVLAVTYAENEVRERLPDKLNRLFEKDFSSISVVYDEALVALHTAQEMLIQQFDKPDYLDRRRLLDELEQGLSADEIGKTLVDESFDKAKRTLRRIIDELEFIQKAESHEDVSAQVDIEWAFETVGLNDMATDEEIKKRRKELFKMYHPDKFQQHDIEIQKEQEENFKLVRDAFDIIRDEARPNIGY